MTEEQTTELYDAPSLVEEAKQQGIEIMETGTDQISYEGNEEGDPLQDNDEGDVTEETENEEESSSPEEGGDDSDTEENLQEEVDKHSKAVNSIKKDLKEKGVDFNVAVKEYESTGTLSEETIKSLEEAGYPAEVIESFIEGRKAIEAKFTDAVYSVVGGEKEYQKIISWASSNLQKRSIDSFNRAVDNNNLDAITLMLEGMKAKMIAKMGTSKKSIHGSAKPSRNTPKGFTSKSEIVKAMSDSRYGRDPQYTREVEQKMWATTM